MASLEVIGDSKVQRSDPKFSIPSQKSVATPSESGDVAARQRTSTDIDLDQRSTEREGLAEEEEGEEEDELVSGPALRFAGQPARWHYDSEEFLGQVRNKKSTTPPPLKQ